MTGVGRGYNGFAGVDRGWLGLTGAGRGCQGFAGVDRGWRRLAEVVWVWQRLKVFGMG